MGKRRPKITELSPIFPRQEEVLIKRVAELEKELEEVKEKYRYACEEITSRREDAQDYYETQEWLFEERRAFNHLPFYKKMFFRFDF